jgi:hypothetical protein
MLYAATEDPLVSLDDIAAIRGQLFRRWGPAYLALGLKMLVLWLVGTVALYFLVIYLYPDLTRSSVRLGVLGLVSVMVFVPFAMYVAKGLWLDYRIARRLAEMALRLHAGEEVRASEVRS